MSAPGSAFTRTQVANPGTPMSFRAKRSVTNAYWMTNAFVPRLIPTIFKRWPCRSTSSPASNPNFRANDRSRTISSSARGLRPRASWGGPPRPFSGSNPVRKIVPTRSPFRIVERRNRTGAAVRTPGVRAMALIWSVEMSDEPLRMFVALSWRTQRSARFCRMYSTEPSATPR